MSYVTDGIDKTVDTVVSTKYLPFGDLPKLIQINFLTHCNIENWKHTLLSLSLLLA